MPKKESLYKILILGDSSVGKTCFLMRYADNIFQETHMSTIGIDYKLKNIYLKDDKLVKLQIWDTAGQDRFHSITKTYYKGANGIILIYSVIDRKTFENVQNWLNSIKNEVSDKVVIFLVGNKIDAADLRQVTYEQGEEMAESYKLPFFECSAKTAENIEETFNELVKKILENNEQTSSKGKKLKQKQVGGNKKCC